MEEHEIDLGSALTKSMGNGLFELRIKAQEGIGRAFFCYRRGHEIIILHAFIKKTQKTPAKEIAIAMKRLNEVNQDEKVKSYSI